MCAYLIFECLGVLRLFWVWLRYSNSEQWIYRNRLIQIWWATGLLRVGAILFRLTFSVSGKEAIPGNSAILLIRHASLGDTVLPLEFFSEPRNNEGVRYVIKKELRISPSLDIAAHRLNTVFVDRSGSNTQAELERIAEIASTAPADESLMIYPEGTRVTASKRAHLEANYPDLRPQLARWPDLLPPRLGGISAMLTNNPGKDIVFMAHVGFEGLADLKELLSGRSRGGCVKIHFWRVPFEQIPQNLASELEEFIFAQWDVMQATVQKLRHSDPL